jgi:hypothetical protein
MSKYQYNYRIQANFNFDWNQVNNPPTDPSLYQFSQNLWAGQDDEGWCVFKLNPFNNTVLRIDFFPPVIY